MNNPRIYTTSEKEREEIIHLISSHLMSIPEIAFAYLYGSFVDPDSTFFRDIDIGIYIIDKDLEWQRYALELPSEVEKVINYRYPVDLIIINSANIMLKKNVIEGKLLFARDEDLWADFVVDVALKYSDIVPVFNHYFKEAYIEK